MKLFYLNFKNISYKTRQRSVYVCTPKRGDPYTLMDLYVPNSPENPNRGWRYFLPLDRIPEAMKILRVKRNL